MFVNTFAGGKRVDPHHGGMDVRNQPRFVYGQEMIDYIWKCFCPAEPREQCATRYDFNLWGIYQPIVCYFKDRHQAGQNQGNMQDIYVYFGFESQD